MKTSTLPATLVVSAMSCAAIAADETPAVLDSTVFAWEGLESRPIRTGERRQAFDVPTATLDKFHCHITTLNPGENTGPLHKHPQEELVILKTGTLEVNIGGKLHIVTEGSLIFFAVNEMGNMRNIGDVPATYYVIQWYTPKTPKE